MALITLIGRGHSGTRAMAHTLYASGVFMGSTINPSGDLVPPHAMYDACRIFARYVRWRGDLSWDFGKALNTEIPERFTTLIHRYLESVLARKARHRGWKIPETVLCYPWLVRMFPDAKYIVWVRNPRDAIRGQHVTDDLRDFGIHYPDTDDDRRRRAISWKYQYDLIEATPRPEHQLVVRFEDFVLRQEETLLRLEDFLGLKLARIIVWPENLNRFEGDQETNYFDFLESGMKAYGYEIPALGGENMVEAPR